jgi:hypothetical protein
MFKLDICLINEAGKLGDIDIIILLRNHPSDLTILLGDPDQIGPFEIPRTRKLLRLNVLKTAVTSKGKNAFENQMRKSTIGRAIGKGGVPDSTTPNPRTELQAPMKPPHKNNNDEEGGRDGSR